MASERDSTISAALGGSRGRKEGYGLLAMGYGLLYQLDNIILMGKELLRLRNNP
jgi:hypothetical protein